MRRLLWILLLVFCSSARAQLLPIIFDQAVTLPEETDIWDVMPHPDGYYVWVAATEPQTEHTRIYWGRMDVEGYDSLDLTVGAPQKVVAFWRNEYEPTVLLASRFMFGELDSTLFCAYRLTDGQPMSLNWTFPSGTWPWPTGGFTNTDFRLALAAPVPPPPQNSTRVAALIRHRWHWWEMFPPGVMVHGYSEEAYSSPDINAADSFNYQTIPCDIASSAMFDTTLYVSVSSSDTRVWGEGGAVDSAHGAVLTTIPESYWYPITELFCEYDFGSPNSCFTYPAICTYDSINGAPIMFTRVESQYGVTDSAHYGFWRWTIPGPYDLWLPAEVIHNNGAEEILAYDQYRRVFDLLGARDGHNYGVTDSIRIDSTSSPKIVSRYDSTFRRLALRSGNQLHLYRFGQYLSAEEDFIPQPSSFILSSYPNPFNSATEIRFEMPRGSEVTLKVFDITGREVAVLVNGQMNSGEHCVTFDASALPSGIYLARLTAGEITQIQKMVLLK